MGLMSGRWRLPETVVVPLQALARGLATGRAPGIEVERVRAALAALPLRWLMIAEMEVGHLLDMRGPPTQSGRQTRDLDLLRLTPGLEYPFLFHKSGYCREAALRKLGGQPPATFWTAAIAYRQNDWVEPVRKAACDCVSRLFPLLAPEVMAEAAYFLLTRMPMWGRWQLEPKVPPDGLLLEQAEVAAALAHHIGRATSGPAGAVLRQALRQPGLDGHLPALAIDAVQPIVRLVALHTLIEGAAIWPDGHEREIVNKPYQIYREVPVFARRPIIRPGSSSVYLDMAARDRSVIVRRLAAATLAKQLGRTETESWMEHEPVLTLLERDPDKSIRDRIAFIRRFLHQGPPTLVQALEALCSPGTPEPVRDRDLGRDVELLD
ncbi:MAG: hypothetical protein PW843_02995 [Azospirillaceae bacterium]|nr:hypothetical protein [Azospirillaceae bacterium]